MCKTMLLATTALLLSAIFAIASSSVSSEIEFGESFANEDLQSVDGISPTESYQANSIRNSRSIHGYSRPELEVYLLKRPTETDRDLVCQCKCANKKEDSDTTESLQNKIQHFNDPSDVGPDWHSAFRNRFRPRVSSHIIRAPSTCPRGTAFAQGKCRLIIN
ncbi:hypothetical protein M0802_002934 [Mischocyttarus mexicanus]|nr:hypothetical protein M0802_002934 [Mischocyttarus mexicanus]